MDPFLNVPEGEIKDLGLSDPTIDWNDKVSAIKVEPGCKLVAWRSQHFQGKQVFKDIDFSRNLIVKICDNFDRWGIANLSIIWSS